MIKPPLNSIFPPSLISVWVASSSASSSSDLLLISDSTFICAGAALECASGMPSSGMSSIFSAADSVYFPQFSAKAFSSPQTKHSGFIVSAVQVVSQVHIGGSSVSPSANAVIGTRQNTIHRVIKILNNRFLILSPPLCFPSTV